MCAVPGVAAGAVPWAAAGAFLGYDAAGALIAEAADFKRLWHMRGQTVTPRQPRHKNKDARPRQPAKRLAPIDEVEQVGTNMVSVETQ